MLANLPVALLAMLPRYLSVVLPNLPAQGASPTDLLPTAMLAIGAAAEALGVYILLVAGTDRVPERWRFRRYRLWMRTELLLWWTVLALGISVYAVWYM